MKRTWLIAYRKSKNLSQKELAQILGKSQITYSMYESGQRQIP